MKPLKEEKGRVDLCQMLQIFHPSNWCTDIWKTLFVILELQFDHESGLIRTRYFELFFSVWSIFSSYKKSAPNEAGFMFFWTFAVILAKYTISTSSKKNHCKIWVITYSKHAANITWWVYWMRNNCLLLSTFCTFQNPIDHLNQ